MKKINQIELNIYHNHRETQIDSIEEVADGILRQYYGKWTARPYDDHHVIITITNETETSNDTTDYHALEQNIEKAVREFEVLKNQVIHIYNKYIKEA